MPTPLASIPSVGHYGLASMADWDGRTSPDVDAYIGYDTMADQGLLALANLATRREGTQSATVWIKFSWM